MTKTQLGEWAHVALLADVNEIAPFEHSRRLEISMVIHQLMHMAEGSEYELEDSELRAMVERLD